MTAHPGSSSTWIWIWESAEIVALDSFGVEDVVRWSCREGAAVHVDLPVDVARETVLIEDSDCLLDPDEDFVEVSGRVAAIRVAQDQWHRAEQGCLKATPGTRSWTDADRTDTVRRLPPDGGASGYLVRLDAI